MQVFTDFPTRQAAEKTITDIIDIANPNWDDLEDWKQDFIRDAAAELCDELIIEDAEGAKLKGGEKWASDAAWETLKWRGPNIDFSDALDGDPTGSDTTFTARTISEAEEHLVENNQNVFLLPTFWDEAIITRPATNDDNTEALDDMDRLTDDGEVIVARFTVRSLDSRDALDEGLEKTGYGSATWAA